jgi:hypothetical protein
MSKDQVWVWAEHTIRAGDVARERYEDFGGEPDSADYIALDVATACLWATLPASAATAFRRRAGRNVIEYMGIDPTPSDAG